MLHLSQVLKNTMLFASLLLLLSIENVNAQKLSVGPQLGANLTRIDGEGFKNGFNMGYHAGGFASIGLSKKWFTQVEVLWSQINSQKATQFSDLYNNLLEQDFQNPKLEYLSIPVSFYFKPSKLISLQAGVQYAILMNHNRTFLENGEDAFRKGDASAFMGLQLHVLGFKVYGRYMMGISDIGNANLENEWKSSTIQLGLALAIL